MRWYRVVWVACSVSIAAAGPRRLDSQQVLPPAGLRRVTTDTGPAAYRPSELELAGKSMGWAAYGAVVAGGIGLIVDDQYCERYHRHEPSGLFGRCFAYVGTGGAVGWFGGAAVGATVGAVRVARRRGCQAHTAVARAVVGAVLGVLPGVAVVAHRPGRYPPGRSAWLFGAPLLAGAGAAIAVRNCRAL
jgi:hypothetical protein